jgi:hypothetical protein
MTCSPTRTLTHESARAVEETNDSQKREHTPTIETLFLTFIGSE